MLARPFRELAIALALVAGCAGIKSHYALRQAVDAHRIERPLEVVWPEALKLLADRGYPLVGHDREVAGQRGSGSLLFIFDRGHETRKLEDGRLTAETNYGGQKLRYRVDGTDTGGGTCRVAFVAIQGNIDRADEDRMDDPRMALDLLRRVEPEAAERIEAALAQPAR